MKKHVFFTLCGILVISMLASAQTPSFGEQVADDQRNESKQIRAKFELTNDKTDMLEITGIGGSTFSTSNTYDGTAKSYRHALRITIALLTANNKAGNFELIFYSDNEIIPYAAGSAGATTYIFYPINLYESIKEKLEQSFAAKKRVQLKVVQKLDGFREGTLTF